MELIHAFNRGADKRIIFMDERDRIRFVHDMYEFNDLRPAINTAHGLHIDVRRRYMRKRERIVTIHGWCLMKNHYHLLLSEEVDGGITTFLRKLNGGYTKYINEKYRRQGVLFQGKTKRKLIDSESYFLHILHYIHLNPLDYLQDARHWRKGSIARSDLALAYLDKYRWSSYRDYCGTKNFPSLIETDLFSDVYGDYRKKIRRYVQEIDQVAITEISLE